MNALNYASRLLLLVSIACHPIPPYPPTVQEPASEPATLEGVVTRVERPADSQSYVRVVVTPAGKRPIRLVLAPDWYLHQQGIRYEPRETLSIEGKRVVKDGEPAIIVRTLRQDQRNYLLRDEGDRPLWLAP